MKKILFLIPIFALAFLAGTLIQPKVQAETIDNGDGWSACESTGTQCGTANGEQYKTKDRRYEWVCPDGYREVHIGHLTLCVSFRPGQLPFTPLIKEYKDCPKGWFVDPDNEAYCKKVRDCELEEPLYDGCDPVGQCPTECGYEGGTVPDGRGGEIKCDPQSACPTPTETPKEECRDLGYGCNGSPSFPHDQGPPTCTDASTVNLPANVHVVRSGSDATVNFFVTQGDHANIYYREVGEKDWTHSVIGLNVGDYKDKYISYTIHDLKANVGYEFGIQQVIGCGGGQLVTAVVVDGPNSQTFGFSYWEWSK